MSTFEPIDITNNFYQLGSPSLSIYRCVADTRGLAPVVTEACHRERGDWVRTFAEHMPDKMTASICGRLIKLFQAEADHPDLSFKF